MAFSLAATSQTSRHRILISTDIGGTDPDDNQSMIHLLMYANEFDIEGLVSSPSFGNGSKEEILRMIDMYEQDLPKLERGLKATGAASEYPSPQYLRGITVQGHKGAAPLCGYAEPTDGSELIVKCARKQDRRPLWILVWGALEDVAQALHDAPDIIENIRIYWIGGPNKKWGCNAYNYIACNYPGLWFIENNATYRGFIGSAKDMSVYESGYWETFMKGAGVMGNDFINYYKGIAKMGDTPSLLYLMNGDADNPCSDHWGGRFEPIRQSPKFIIGGTLCNKDTVPVYSLMEWQLKGSDIDLPTDSACFTLHIDKQDWKGYHMGNGIYTVRYAPKAPATLHYSITSPIPGFPVHEGTFTVGKEWPAIGKYNLASYNHITAVPISTGSKWFTDCSDNTLKDNALLYKPYTNINTQWQGAATTACWREAVMRDWAIRFRWLK